MYEPDEAPARKDRPVDDLSKGASRSDGLLHPADTDLMYEPDEARARQDRPVDDLSKGASRSDGLLHPAGEGWCVGQG